MTNKRYYLGNGELYTICDSSKGGSDFFNMLTQFEVVDLLNNLAEENEQLKSFIKKLTSNDGKIWLMNGYVYKTDKILKGDVE